MAPEDTCPVLLSDGQQCGRPTWDQHCLLHSTDPEKPKDDFLLQVQRTIEGVDTNQRAPGDLTGVYWHAGHFSDVRWNRAVVLRGAHFMADVRFRSAVFEATADFSHCFFDHGLEGSPIFRGDVSFEGSDLDAIRLDGGSSTACRT